MPELKFSREIRQGANVGIGHRLEGEASANELDLGSARDRLFLIHSGLGHAELMPMFSRHYADLCSAATARLNEHFITLEHEDRSSALLAAGIREVERVCEHIAATGRVGTGVRRDLGDFVWSSLDAEVTLVLAERHVLMQETQAALGRLDKADRLLLEEHLGETGQAFAERGVERRQILRDCLTGLQNLTRSPSLAGNSIAFLHLGWLLWSVEDNHEDAVLALKSCPSDTFSPGAAQASLICASELLGALGDDRAGLECCLQSLKTDARPDWMLKAAALAASADHVETALQYLEIAIFQRAFTFVEALAEERLSELVPEILKIASNAQEQAREEASRHILAWERAAKVVKAVKAAVDFDMHVPARLLDGHAQGGQDIAAAHLYLATALSEDSQAATAELCRIARDTVGTVLEERRTELAEARAELESAWCVRERALKAAFEEQEKVVDEARARLSANTADFDSGKGCGMAAGAGCAVMVLYALATAVFAARGMRLGASSPAALVAFSAAVLPALLAFMNQGLQASKRAAVEHELNECVRKAREQFQEAALHADEAYRGAVGRLREHLAKLEEHVRKAEDGQRLLANI